MSNLVAATLPIGGSTSIAPPTTAGALEGFDLWLKDFQKYETILMEMTRVSTESKFKDEVTAIEKWFQVLSEAERTASIYTLIQHSTQDQIRFFMSVLRKMIKSEDTVDNNITDSPAKTKNSKIGLRPPSLNIPLPGSPATPTPTTTSEVQGLAVAPSVGDNDRLNSLMPKLRTIQTPLSPLTSQENSLKTPAKDKSWASMVNTPLVPMFQKPDINRSESTRNDLPNQPGNTGGLGNRGPGLAAINTATLNMLATSGLSNEAQLLAVQLVMSGILGPTDIANSNTKQDQASSPLSASKKKGAHGNWRTPSSAKYPGSSLRSGVQKTSGLKSSGLKSSGLASSGLDSASMESPRVEDFNPELLKDIPAWLRSLRLHKYNSCFEGMSWQEMVIMDDAMLEKKGVAALGARRRLIRTFDHVRREMGMEGASSATPTTSALPSGAGLANEGVAHNAREVPQSAAPIIRLSADSPVFMPTGKVPQSAAPTLALATAACFSQAETVSRGCEND